MNRAKDKMLHHLSHELKTPLAIIDASLSIMKKKVEKSGLDPEQFPFERILRNVDRLRTIEKQVVHIVEGKEYPEKGVIIRFMSYLDDFLDIRQSEDPLLKDALESLRSRILSLFPEKKEESESADIRNVLDLYE